MERIRGFEICKEYENKGINLPVRKTKHAVAYDVEAAEDTIIPSIQKVLLNNGSKVFQGLKDLEDIKPALIKTGLKSYFGEDEVLILANRSSGPFKKNLVMANSIGIIECDYYGNESNDGHLMFSYYNFGAEDLFIPKGEVVGQVYFQKFLVADTGNSEDIRKGGFGSTSN